MRTIAEITYDLFPEQSNLVGKRVEVCYHYGRLVSIGTCIRDDKTEPYRTIFKLDNGRVLLASECQYAPLSKDFRFGS